MIPQRGYVQSIATILYKEVYETRKTKFISYRHQIHPLPTQCRQPCIICLPSNRQTTSYLRRSCNHMQSTKISDSLIPVFLKIKPTDSPSEKFYKQLCIDEINWCRKHSDIIINKAHCLYQLCTTATNYKGKARCLDFKKLEFACDNYNSKF